MRTFDEIHKCFNRDQHPQETVRKNSPVLSGIDAESLSSILNKVRHMGKGTYAVHLTFDSFGIRNERKCIDKFLNTFRNSKRFKATFQMPERRDV